VYINSDQINEKRIAVCETELLIAFRSKDLEALNGLLHESCLLVLPNGKTVTKDMIVESYRSGDTVMTTISGTDQVIQLIGETAVVSVTIELIGNYFEQVINSKFRYIRVWKLVGQHWQVIAGGGIPLVTNKS
jgi:hypothetical protein